MGQWLSLHLVWSRQSAMLFANTSAAGLGGPDPRSYPRISIQQFGWNLPTIRCEFAHHSLM